MSAHPTTLFFDLVPAGRFEARAETIGTDAEELAMFAEIAVMSEEQSRRFATIRENLRHALEVLDGAEPAGRA